MRKVLKYILFGLLGVVVLLVVVAAIIVVPNISKSYPQVDGEIHLQGLDGQVDVYRDEHGIPQIYASSEHDLFFAQGYVHAQDRFWQMDFQRHTSAGRLSELLGSNTLDVDTFLRTVGWERVARQELALMSGQSRAMLESYADGVNAYLADHSGTQISLEYLFLKLLNSNYTPAPWEPLNTITWAKAMAWDLRDNMDNEIERAVLLHDLAPERVAELFPDYPAGAPIVVPDFGATVNAAPFSMFDVQQTEELASFFSRIGNQTAAADRLLGGGDEDLGSNSWVISGDLSATGAPLLANDPHLSAAIPSIWYQIGLHCQPVTADCSFEAAGVSFVGVPGIVLGHNNSIAWGFTNNGADVMDLYIIKVNPENPDQYELNGDWVDMELIDEDIVVAGDETVHLPVRITKFGPIISDSYGDLADIAEKSGLDLPENYAIALKWTALEPGTTFDSLFEMNRAQNFEEFRAAASKFVVPSQNLLYADVDGNIGYQMPGYVPIRAAGDDGRLPRPGWTDEFEWQGFIPFEELPYSYNPASGYILPSNNAIVGSEYPYHLADQWDFGYRAQRIEDMLNAAPGPIDIAYYQEMQGDDMNLGALPIVQALGSIDMQDEHLNELRDMLTSWDGQQRIDSAPAALFNAFFRHLLADTFRDELPEDYWPAAGSGSRWYVVIDNLLADPTNAWWDDTNTPETETSDDMLAKALREAVQELEKKLGKDATQWAWGDLHTITFEHAVMSSFPLIDSIFNRGPFAVAGGNSIVNASSWGDSETYAMASGVSKRTIMDLGNWDNSLQIATIGQSGHAYHRNYADLAVLWANIEYLPMLWEHSTVEASAIAHLVLLP